MEVVVVEVTVMEVTVTEVMEVAMVTVVEVVEGFPAGWVRTVVYRVKGEEEEDDDDDDQGAEAEREEYTLRTESNPFRGTGQNGSMLTIMDMMGIHHLDINWCGCENSPPCDQQLLAMGLYPASTLQPQTAFTFRVLDDYLLTNKECKMSAMSYYSRLHRVTDNAFPQRVPDRYRELLRVSQQWRNLKYQKWHGFGHDLGQKVGSGDLAIFCAACPQPGVNLQDEWEQDTDQEVIDDHMNDSNWKKMTRLVPSLVWKWKKAVDGVISSTNELNDLETTASNTKLAEWRSAAENAQTRRHQEISAMDIYNVQFDKAPTRQAIQLKMMKEESQGKKGQGVTAWLSMGMKAQEKQLELCEVSRQLQGKRMLSDRLKLEKKRQVLQRQIEAFEAKALGVLPGIDEEDGGRDMYRGNDWMDEEDDDELDAELVDGEEGEDGDEEVEAKPEESCLSLPSQLGASAIERRGWGHIAEVELQLQQGQANDTLHEIRVVIGHKSFLFRNRVRPSNSQQTKTQAWGEVQVVAKMVA
ncbi:hypothetical protein WOLCODRAFT_155163 [Wolfiporia cocos MD-104 SS10]|uniref:CxC2-like cysteine cluster KDZ transposase-associated domain-containing protein n=1 Tax=Wolfiporia cocos (strain MD-104) TaxID=742152 RepID=A0A2H3IYJ8_WOLCO|nr:hypothetical protein WOLCODRAFT_155163 [Wolfiporia cocos MD-104 SS10]